MIVSPMTHEFVIDLRTVPDLAALHRIVATAEANARRTLIDRGAAAGKQCQAVVHSWQLRVKIAGGLRVMRMWMPGQDVPTGAERLELIARACLGELPAARSALLRPKGVG